MPLSEEQRKALRPLRAMFAKMLPAPGVAMSFDERARLPTTGIPDDISAHVEIAPPAPNPLPLLPDSALKAPERVPIFFYSLRSTQGDAHTGDVKVIFHIHGGGNLVGHPANDQFVAFFSEILRVAASQSGDTTRWEVVAPCYRLATVPENTFPAALQDLVSAYDYLITKGYKADNIVISGDSAGGNHAIVLPYIMSRSSRPFPNGIVPIAPASIQVYDNLSEHAKAQANNDVISIRMAESGSAAYVGNSGFAPTDPLISGAYIPFPDSWPRTLILVGTADQLIDASRKVEKRLSDIKRPVELVEYDDVPHAWWILPGIFPEEFRDTAQRIVRFVLKQEPVLAGGKV